MMAAMQGGEHVYATVSSNQFAESGHLRTVEALHEENDSQALQARKKMEFGRGNTI